MLNYLLHKRSLLRILNANERKRHKQENTNLDVGWPFDS